MYTDHMKSFVEKVLDVVKKIPEGKVLSYGEVAKRAGNPKASRVVGNIMAENDDKTVPCHRVVRADGSIGMYNGLREKSKEAILKKEGVTFTEKGKVIHG
jgi:O-6-methylguanine DNA methyltransferase